MVRVLAAIALSFSYVGRPGLKAAEPVPQFASASITGVVKDTSGSPIPGATITVTAGDRRAQATSMIDGRFRIEGLPPGAYHVRMQLAGFNTVEAGVILDSGRETSWNPIAAVQWSAPKRSVESYIADRIGADPLGCGRLAMKATAETMTASIECAKAASAKRQAVFVTKQYQGIDSILFHGLLAGADGTIYLLNYDSAPCGGPGCDEKFTLQLCAAPSVRTDRYESYFACAVIR